MQGTIYMWLELDPPGEVSTEVTEGALDIPLDETPDSESS